MMKSAFLKYLVPGFPGFPGFQVETNRVKLLNDRAVSKSQLHKKLGQFLYLNNLEKVWLRLAPPPPPHSVHNCPSGSSSSSFSTHLSIWLLLLLTQYTPAHLAPPPPHSVHTCPSGSASSLSTHLCSLHPQPSFFSIFVTF